jgi:hypothetical protein
MKIITDGRQVMNGEETDSRNTKSRYKNSKDMNENT